METELPCPGESVSSPASVSLVPANRLPLLGFVPFPPSPPPCSCLPFMAQDSSISQLPAQLPLGHEAFTAHGRLDRSAGRWQWVWGSEAGRMEFGAFHSESCFPARRNPVCPSFVPLAVLRLDGLATGVDQMRRDSEGDQRGRERDSESHKERRSQRDPGKKDGGTWLGMCIQVRIRGGRKSKKHRLQWAKMGRRAPQK